MDFTGERMIPGASDPKTFWEHVFRYAFAVDFIAGLTVLDIASGEGYGTKMLSRYASKITGVDIDPEAVDHAKIKYGLDFRIGSAEAIPVEDESVDVVVSFETIEHVPDPFLFIEEAARVLKKDGLFIVSTPNKDVYRHDQESNPFHCSEMSRPEFEKALSEKFVIQKLMGQNFQTEISSEFEDFWYVLQSGGKRISDRLGFYLSRKKARVFQRVQRYYLSHYLNEQFQKVGVQEIDDHLKAGGLISSLGRYVNPFAMRTIRFDEKDQPEFIVAIARRK